MYEKFKSFPEVKQLIQDSILQMKSICYNLTPPELDKGLLYALDVYFGKQNEL